MEFPTFTEQRKQGPSDCNWKNFMRLLDTHIVHTGSGDKHIRLYQGDLASIPPKEAVDLLVVSAFLNDYIPTKTSLIGALYDKGISVAKLSNNKEADLRGAFSCWLSKSLSNDFPNAGFRQLLCFERVGTSSPPETVSHIFRAMMPFLLVEPPIRTVAMPIVAAGDQGYDAGIMLRALFDSAVHWLANGLPVDTIKLVVYRAELADRLRKVFAELSMSFSQSTRLLEREPSTTAAYDFFVSYAHSDASAVEVLVQSLKMSKPTLRLFQDKLELDIGESWQAELDGALESCQRVIAVLSPGYLDSRMCIEEFNMARLRHRDADGGVLTPIYLRTTSLPLYMRTLQYIDCREANCELLLAASGRLTALSSR
jgi:hypothetical protein